MIVIDTNVLVYLLIDGPMTTQAEAVFQQDSSWVAPLVMRSEFRNVLVSHLRRGQLDPPTASQAMAKAEILLAGREFPVSSQAVLDLAFSSGCSAYDCEFVALAKDLGIHLVTADKAVVARFPETAVALKEAPRP